MKAGGDWSRGPTYVAQQLLQAQQSCTHFRVNGDWVVCSGVGITRQYASGPVLADVVWEHMGISMKCTVSSWYTVLLYSNCGFLQKVTAAGGGCCTGHALCLEFKLNLHSAKQYVQHPDHGIFFHATKQGLCGVRLVQQCARLDRSICRVMGLDEESPLSYQARLNLC